MKPAFECDFVARGDVRVLWSAGPSEPPSPAESAAVDAFWHEAVQRSGGRLYDAPVFCVDSWTTEGGVVTVCGHYEAYRRFYAQARGVGLTPPIRALGVSGVVFLHDDASPPQLVLGKRSSHVTQYPGWWECVPAGGVDRSAARDDGTVDCISMLCEELREEAGLPRDRVRGVAPLGLLWDAQAGTYDVCCRLDAVGTAAEVAAGIRASGEYVDTLAVPLADVEAWLTQRRSELVPTTLAAIRAAAG